jgi:cytochrome c oxidase cbb3-type subunit 2
VSTSGDFEETNTVRSKVPAVLVVAVLVAGCTGKGPTGAGRNQALELELQGKRVYAAHCAGCHGVKGDGEGPAARFLDPKPRDFVAASFKFRSTPSGYLPTDEDLMRTLNEGVHSTSMPAWRMLSVTDRQVLISYLKTLSKRWKDEEEYSPKIAMPGAPSSVGTPESIRAGYTIYGQMKCAQCHGVDGSGRGATATHLTDAKGDVIVPLDFSRRTPKGGAAPADYYRAFTTGLDGTPMPSYGDGVLTDEQRWDLVSFVMALREHRGKVPAELTGATEEDAQ